MKQAMEKLFTHRGRKLVKKVAGAICKCRAETEDALKPVLGIDSDDVFENP